MITKIRLVFSVTTLLTLLFCTFAQALTFTVSNVNFTNVVGSNDTGQDFQWRLIPEADFTFDLDVGQKHTFTYGRFRTADFPIDLNDANDNDDSFTSNFTLTPPGTDFMVNGTPDAVQLTKPDYIDPITGAKGDPDNDYAFVNFDSSSWQQIAFGNGGLFSLRFLSTNPDYLYDDGSFRLRARVRYDVAPVPEPGTLLLLGAGLVGLAVLRKRQRR